MLEQTQFLPQYKALPRCHASHCYLLFDFKRRVTVTTARHARPKSNTCRLMQWCNMGQFSAHNTSCLDRCIRLQCSEHHSCPASVRAAAARENFLQGCQYQQTWMAPVITRRRSLRLGRGVSDTLSYKDLPKLYTVNKPTVAHSLFSLLGFLF